VEIRRYPIDPSLIAIYPYLPKKKIRNRKLEASVLHLRIAHRELRDVEGESAEERLILFDSLHRSKNPLIEEVERTLVPRMQSKEVEEYRIARDASRGRRAGESRKSR